MNTTAILIIAIIAILILWWKDRKKMMKEHGESIKQKNQEISFLKNEMETVHIPDTMYGIDRAYYYGDVKLIPAANVDFSKLVRERISFTFIDEQAVAWIANKPVATVMTRGIAYMIRDWLQSGDPIFAAFMDSEELTCAIAFYKKGVKEKREARSVSFTVDGEDED